MEIEQNTASELTINGEFASSGRSKTLEVEITDYH